MKLEYLLFNIVIFCGSTIAALSYPRRILPRPKPTLFAIGIVATFFILWDQMVTNWWWYFAARFTTGYRLGALPIEEVIFFFVVPWSCLVLFVHMRRLITGHVSFNVESIVGVIGVVVSVLSLMYSWWYTATVSAFALGIAIVSYHNNRWLRRKSSLLLCAVVILLTLIFNGYLTARPIVTYNPQVISNLRFFTIPIEDIIYGLVMICATGMIYERINE